MRTISNLLALAVGRVSVLILAVVIGQRLTQPLRGAVDGEETASAQSADARFAPYADDPGHPWNRLHRALFVRELDGERQIHSTDPLLYRGGSYLLEGEPHHRAIGLLDKFQDAQHDRLIDDPLKRLFFQRDLWAAFDYVAWYPDDWVFQSKHEPAAVALRNRLATVIGCLALGPSELAALPDNYQMAIQAKQYAAAYDPQHPERPFLPPDLFDPNGPWVWFHQTMAEPMARQHFDGAGGRAVHVILIRLPGGRDATEQYLQRLHPQEPYLEETSSYSVPQFPPGTMVAMVRRALTVDQSASVRVTPVTELVQIRVYRRIPSDPAANLHGDRGEQDVYEYLLDRSQLFAGAHGLRAVKPDEPAKPFFDRSEGRDPFQRIRTPLAPEGTQLSTCMECHQAPGVYSVLSMERGLRRAEKKLFRTYDWDVELNYTVGAKVKRFDWGLLKGKLEAK